MSIVDYSIPYSGPTIKTIYFPNTKSSSYWSSTTLAGDPSASCYVVFYYDDVFGGSKDISLYVRCVRGGQ